MKTLPILLGCAALYVAVQAADTKPPTPAIANGAKQELSADDGTSAGRRSMAGNGHAVLLQAPSTNCFLTGVRIFASRYGQSAPPNENAHIWLCDADFKAIAAFTVPYARFPRGTPQWVNIPLNATRLPQKFVLCVGFNPTATKGVYVHHDAAGSGSSFSALPGNKGPVFEKGDWMIRATVQEGEGVKTSASTR